MENSIKGALGVGDVDIFIEIFKTKLQEHFKDT